MPPWSEGPQRIIDIFPSPGEAWRWDSGWKDPGTYALDTSSSHQLSLRFERQLFISSEGAKAMQWHSSWARHLFVT